MTTVRYRTPIRSVRLAPPIGGVEAAARLYLYLDLLRAEFRERDASMMDFAEEDRDAIWPVRLDRIAPADNARLFVFGNPLEDAMSVYIHQVISVKEIYRAVDSVRLYGNLEPFPYAHSYISHLLDTYGDISMKTVVRAVVDGFMEDYVKPSVTEQAYRDHSEVVRKNVLREVEAAAARLVNPTTLETLNKRVRWNRVSEGMYFWSKRETWLGEADHIWPGDADIPRSRVEEFLGIPIPRSLVLPLIQEILHTRVDAVIDDTEVVENPTHGYHPGPGILNEFGFLYERNHDFLYCQGWHREGMPDLYGPSNPDHPWSGLFDDTIPAAYLVIV